MISAYAVASLLGIHESHLAMIRLCIDASGGGKGHRAMAVAGYFAPVKDWSKFETQWAAALVEARVEQFHATDFYSCEGEFNGWDLDPARHAKFAKRFTAIAESKAGYGIARGIDVAAFKRVMAPVYATVRTDRTPHCKHTQLMFGVTTAVHEVCQLMRKRGEAVAVILEGGDGVCEVIEYHMWLKRKRVKWTENLVTMLPMGKDFLPLQAADLLAYEMWHHTTGVLGPNPRPPRRPALTRLLQRSRVELRIASHASLERAIPPFKAFLTRYPAGA